MANSTSRGIVYPTSSDTITPLETVFATLAQTADDAISDIEPQTVQVFENTADRDAASVPEGSFCFVKNIDTPYYFDGLNWVSFVPTSLPASVITSGVFDVERIPADIDITGTASYADNAGSATVASGIDFLITNGMIATDAVTQSKIAANAVGSSELINGSVTEAQLGTGAVTNTKIGSGAVTNSKLGSASVQGSQGTGINVIQDNSIGQLNIGPDAIGTSELIEGIDPTFGIVYSTGGFYVDGTTRIGTSGAMYPQTNTTTLAANVRQPSDGANLQRSSSARKYKFNIQDAQYALKALELKPRTWIDKAEYEKNNNSEDGLRRVVGFVAEELIDIGLGEFVMYGPNGEVESIAYERLTAAVIPVLKNLNDRLTALEGKVE